MSAKEDAQKAIAAVLDRIQQISERSDVQYHRKKIRLYDTQRWRGRMPEDFRLFYQRLGGLEFRWGFRDDNNYQHGPRFHSLGPDGRSVYERVEAEEFLSTESRMPAEKFELLGPEVQAWGKDPVTVFSGRAGERGLLQRERADDTFGFYYFKFHTVVHIADSFLELLNKALPSGFAYGWEGRSAPSSVAQTRLAEEVAPRELVVIEVVERAEISNEDYRAELAAEVSEEAFDRLMVALERKERSGDLNAEKRITILLDAFMAAGKWSAKACKVGAPLVRSYQKSTRKAVKQALRLVGPPAVKIHFHVKKQDTEGAPAIHSPRGLLWPMLRSAFNLQESDCHRMGGEQFESDMAQLTWTFYSPEAVQELVKGWRRAVAIDLT